MFPLAIIMKQISEYRHFSTVFVVSMLSVISLRFPIVIFLIISNLTLLELSSRC